MTPELEDAIRLVLKTGKLVIGQYKNGHHVDYRNLNLLDIALRSLETRSGVKE
jgi:hypothetical protein